jgi:hypothetical protein
MEKPMVTWLKLVVAALITLAVAVLLVGSVAAQTVDPEPTAALDSFCDYCKDYTDTGTASRPPTTAYVPGVGYPAERQKEAATATPQRLEEAGLRLLR